MQTDEQTVIRAQELRIGNWVQYRKYKNPTQNESDTFLYSQINSISRTVAGEYITVVKRKENADYYFHESEGRLQPIELTPEILEKAGFEKVLGVLYSSAGPRRGDYIHRRAAFYLQFTGAQYYMVKMEGVLLQTVEHLHQLQNLYFALTGEELNIEL